MGSFEPTPEQRRAMEDRGGSLLVSAAAGSGKTKVLVERLFGYMERERCRIDDFLIITFTKAAAVKHLFRSGHTLNDVFFAAIERTRFLYF